MDTRKVAMRLGAGILAAALVLGAARGGAFDWIGRLPPEALSLLIYLQTGRVVRLPSIIPTQPTQPPSDTQPTLAPVILPVFSQQDLLSVIMRYGCESRPDLAHLLTAPLAWDLRDGQPAVLIIHTPATECYTPTELDSYEVSEGDRCTDPGFSVVRVGDELTDALRAQGIRVIHDRTLFDGDSYTGAYARSNAAVRAWLKKDPSIAVVLDIHRDALNAEGSTRYRLALETASGDAAQMLSLVGTDGSGANHPNWQSNLSLGLKLQRGLNEIAPGIVRPMLLTNGSYDQEVCPGALLIEVGANGNSLSDALVSAGYLGEVLGNILK